MIKKTHFLQLVLLVMLLFVLYQITSISISFDAFKSSFENDRSNESIVVNGSIQLSEDINNNVLLITDKDSTQGKFIQQGLQYLKKSYNINESLLSYSNEDLKDIGVIIIAAEDMTNVYDFEIVQRCMKNGINIIMANMPKTKDLNDEWYELMGIKSKGDNYVQGGVRVLSGFFIGGQHDYKKMELQTSEVKVSSTAKSYIVSLLDESKEATLENEGIIDILWRNIYEDSQIYVVNGDLFNDSTSMGILTAIFNQIVPDFIYPVVNAKALIIENAPYLSSENENVLKEKYARDTQRFFEDIVLPDIVALSLSTGNIPTFYGVESFRDIQMETNTKSIPVLEQELIRIGGELGISTYNDTNTIDSNKIKEIVSLYKQSLNEIIIKSIFLHNEEYLNDSFLSDISKYMEISSLVINAGGDTPISYDENNNIVNIPVITEGFTYTDEELFKEHSMITALGVIVHGIDMTSIIHPEEPKDDWAVASKGIASLIDTYWDDYKVLDGLNISNTRNRIMSFLEMVPNITYGNNSINILIDGFNNEAFFILSTDKKITSITNGSFDTIGDGEYLITADEDSIEITLGQ